MTRWLALGIVLTCACTLKGAKKQPDFKRFTKTHQVAFDPGPIAGGAGSLQITSASISEVYTVFGNEGWSITVDLTLENHGDQVLWLRSMPVKFETAQPSSCGNNEEVIHPRDTTGLQLDAEGTAFGIAPGGRAMAFVSTNCSYASKLGNPFYMVFGSWRVPLRKT